MESNKLSSNEYANNQTFAEAIESSEVTPFETGFLHNSSQIRDSLFEIQSSNNCIEKEIRTLRLLNTASSLLKCEESDLDTFVSRFNDQLEKSHNDAFDEPIDFDDIAADIEINDIFLSTSTPTENFINNELNLITEPDVTEENLKVDDFVSINNEKRGYLRYIGKVHFASGTFCGIELNEPVGKHDGKLQNVRYFQCEQLHGIFAPIEKVTLVITPHIDNRTINNFPDLESTYSFKPIADYEQIYSDAQNSDLDFSNHIPSLRNESSLSLNSKVLPILSQQENSKISCDLNKTFDLTKNNSSEMIQTTSRLNTESRLKSSLIKPSVAAPSSILGPKSSTSSTSSMTSHSSTSSHQNSNTKNLQCQMKVNKIPVNKIGTTNSSTPVKGLSKPISVSEKKVGAVPLGNANMNVMQPKVNTAESTLKYKSKLNPPSKLIKFAAASTTVNNIRAPIQKQSTDSAISQPQQQVLTNSSLKKQIIPSVNLISTPTPIANNLFENKQTKPIPSVIESNLKEKKTISTLGETAKKVPLKTGLKSNELSARLQKLQPNSASSKLLIPSSSTHAPKTSSPNRSPTRKQPESVSKITRILKAPTATKISSIPSLGVAKTQVPSQNVKPTTTMISTNNVKRTISAIKPVESSVSSTKFKKPDASQNATSTPNKEKSSLLNVKHTSRSSSNTSSTSRSSSIISNRSSSNLVASKTKQVTKVQNPTTTTTSSLNMYQPSISLLSKPMINSKAKERKSLQPISNKSINQLIDNTKMNETFDIDENDFDENGLQNYIDNSQDFKQSKTESKKIETIKTNQTEASKRRHSILSIENNFEIMSADHAQKNNLLDGFLEFEEIPEFIDDYIPDTNNSTMTTQKENNNNSLLDVDSFAQLFDNSPSVNNLKWLNSKIEEEKIEFKRKSLSKNNSIENVPNTSESPKVSDKEIIEDSCHLVLKDLINKVSKPSLEIFTNECQVVLNDILDRIQLDDSQQTQDKCDTQETKEIFKKSAHKDANHMEQTSAETQLNKSLVTDEKLVEENLDKNYPTEEIKREMQANEKSVKPTEVKKNPVAEKTRLLLSKSSAATQIISKNSKPPVNNSTTNQNLPLSIPKVKRSTPVETSKVAASRTLHNQLDSSNSTIKTPDTSTSRVSPRKIVSKTTLSAKPVKISDIKQEENDLNSKSDIDSQSTNSAFSSDDGSEKSVFVKKSTVLKSTTTKSSTKTATVPITNTSSINKSSSSINSTKTAPEKEPFTPTTAKLISKTARATRLNNLSTTKQKHSNNKENQQTSVPKSLATSKMYRSRDGLAASNTSIMSEVSNISLNSKSSIPTSNIRHSSISSSTSAASKTNSLLIQKQPGSFAEPKQTPTTHRFNSSTPAKNSQLLRNLNGTTADQRKTSLQSDSKSSIFKRSGALQNSSVSGRNLESLSVNTTLPANSRTITPASSISPSIRAKNEINSKNNEIARLEALCESRTKELTVQKIQLRDTIISFDAIAVAFKYLANDLQGFEVTSLRKTLKLNKQKLEENIKTLKSEIDIKNNRLMSSQAQLEKLIVESSETKTKLENKLKSMKDEHEKECAIMQKETEVMLDEIKAEKESTILRMNKMMESSRLENESLVSCLREQLKNKEIQNVELEIRIKECEETLAKDKDERIQRLLDIQHNLEKEIESLKAALDIKNCDLFDLRKKNNELTTKLDGLCDVEMKYKRYKQELENLNSIIHNKNEQERLAAENNRNLAMKVEIKNKENQRLSMQNEQLQFRLQSQPNLSLTNDNNSFDLSDISLSNENSFFNKVHENDNISAYYDQCASISSTKRSMTMKETKTTNYTDEQTPVVKLRSKSFKAPLMAKHSYDSSLASEKKFSMSFHNNNSNRQFRPVSENFDFDLRDHEFNTDYELTRSDILYEDNDTDTHNTNSLTDGCSNEKYSHSNSSSTSLLDSQSTEDPMTKSVPCMVLKPNSDDRMTSSESSNYNKDFMSEQNNDCDNFNSMSTSSNSMNEHSVVILD